VCALDYAHEYQWHFGGWLSYGGSRLDPLALRHKLSLALPFRCEKKRFTEHLTNLYKREVCIDDENYLPVCTIITYVLQKINMYCQKLQNILTPYNTKYKITASKMLRLCLSAMLWWGDFCQVCPVRTADLRRDKQSRRKKRKSFLRRRNCFADN